MEPGGLGWPHSHPVFPVEIAFKHYKIGAVLETVYVIFILLAPEVGVISHVHGRTWVRWGGPCVPSPRPSAPGTVPQGFCGAVCCGDRGVLVGSSVLARSKGSLDNLGLPSGTRWLKLPLSHLSRWPREVTAGPHPGIPEATARTQPDEEGPAGRKRACFAPPCANDSGKAGCAEMNPRVLTRVRIAKDT